MALKIRLRKQGRHNRPFYRVVVANVRSPRDGKYVEALGWYNPLEKEEEKTLCLHSDRLKYWIEQGAQVSDCVHALMNKKTPSLIKEMSAREVAKRQKALAKEKARKKKAA